MGPIVVAGAPLSYWAGQNGRNPFRYFGGIAGGAVPALLAADLGAGKFDGAHLVLNFELLNPGKNWFRKILRPVRRCGPRRRALSRSSAGGPAFIS